MARLDLPEDQSSISPPCLRASVVNGYLPTGCRSGGGSPLAWLAGMGEDGLGQIHFEQKGTPRSAHPGESRLADRRRPLWLANRVYAVVTTDRRNATNAATSPMAFALGDDRAVPVDAACRIAGGRDAAGIDQTWLTAGCRRSVESLPACARLRAGFPAPDACP